MPYRGFSKEAIIFLYAPWYNVSRLLREITAIRRTNYSVVESRTQALERLNSAMEAQPIFSGEVRFPVTDLFVCELYGDWSRKFQQLKSSLSSRERDIRTQLKENSEIGLNSDAQNAFWNATTAMYEQLLRGDGVFNRDEFEYRMKLVWEEPDH